MDLIDRYIAAIARELPEAQAADVAAELRDVLISEVEAAEGRLGRALTAEEQDALLVRFGHPLTVAGRYRKVQYVIGPEVFPFWWAGLKAALAIVAGLYVVLVVLKVVAGDGVAAVGRIAPSLTDSLIFAFGAVTLTCALIERFGKTALLTRWTPRQLAPVRGPARSRFEIAIDLGVGLVFILWWTGAIQFRDLIPETDKRLEMAAVWRAWFWPILAYAFYEAGVNAVALARAARPGLIDMLTVARHLAAAAILAAILSAGRWVDVTSGTLSPAELVRAQDLIDRVGAVVIGVAIAIHLACGAMSLWRLYRSSRSQTAPPTAPAAQT